MAALQQENCPDALPRCAFLSGDWTAVEALLTSQGKTFDVVLSSETVYSVESCPALALIIQRLLAPGGVAVLSNKRFYFGVGGGTRAFEVEARKLALRVDVVQVLEDRGSNIREVCTVRHDR